jgi:two-component system sensor histidine kinase TctE
VIVPDASYQPPLELDKAVYCDGKVNGRDVRIATIKIVDPESGKPMVLRAAETLNGRNQLVGHMLMNIFLSELVVICIGVAAIQFGVGRGLRSLNGLQSEVARRASGDLRHIDEEVVPKEVLPIVHALNDLLDRLNVEIESQKRFVANAAHQIRTPVAGMKTYVGLAKRLAQAEELKKVLDQVDEGTDRLTHLTNRLLSLARAEPNKRRVQSYATIDLNEVVATALSDLVPKAITKEIDLGYEASSKPALVSGSPEGLEELVTNIVENAILYTPDHGHVSVRITNSDGVTLSVEDNGPGIPHSEREQVFERFYRVLGTEPSGSGLGLAIVKEIAAAHGADVKIADAASGIGTVVTVHLPSAHD